MAPVFDLDLNLKGTKFENYPYLLGLLPYVDSVTIKQGGEVKLQTFNISEEKASGVKEALESIGLNPRIKEAKG